MKAYVEVLRVDGVLRVTASQIVARLPLGMLSLLILIHVQHQTGSYAIAGAVVACMTISEALAMPLTGRYIGSVGPRRMLMLTALLHSTCLMLLAVVGGHVPLLIATGVAVGLSVPPLTPAVRALYPQIVSDDGVRVLFALDTTTQELIWIVGPLLATVIATSTSTALGLGVAAAITSLGTAWFVLSPRVLTARFEPATARFGGVLLDRSILFAMASTAGLVASFTALEVAIISQYEQDAVRAGAAIATASAGSLAGGLLFGHRRFDLLRLIAAMAVVCLGTTAAGLNLGAYVFAGALFLSGMGFAPALAALYYMVANVVEPRAATEAFGWMQTAILVGAASGTAVSGAVGEHAGPPGAYFVATLAAILAAFVPVLARAAGPIAGLHQESKPRRRARRDQVPGPTR